MDKVGGVLRPVRVPRVWRVREKICKECNLFSDQVKGLEGNKKKKKGFRDENWVSAHCQHVKAIRY